jgi:hypothetical protein
MTDDRQRPTPPGDAAMIAQEEEIRQWEFDFLGAIASLREAPS